MTAASARPIAHSARLPRLRASGLAHTLADGLNARKGGRRLSHLPLSRNETRFQGLAIPDDQSGPYRIDKHTRLLTLAAASETVMRSASPGIDLCDPRDD